MVSASVVVKTVLLEHVHGYSMSEQGTGAYAARQRNKDRLIYRRIPQLGNRRRRFETGNSRFDSSITR